MYYKIYRIINTKRNKDYIYFNLSYYDENRYRNQRLFKTFELAQLFASNL